MGERRREVVYRLVKVEAKSEVGERRWEVVYQLVKIEAKS